MKSSNITFILFGYNEAHRIEYAVRNLVPYGTVYLLDGGSTDGTREIAERWGAVAVDRPDITSGYLETPEMLAYAKTLTKTDWIFWSYVDNILPKTLLEKLSEIARGTEYDYVHVPIYTYMWGDVEHPVIKASYSCFFKKDLVDFTGNTMHGMGRFTGEKSRVLHLPMNSEFAMRHFSLYDLNKFVGGHLKYANAEAEQRYEGGKRFSLKYMTGSMAHYFWLFYKIGWRAGVRGLYGALLYVFFRLMMAIRLYELEHGITLETIEQSFAKEKKKLVNDVESAQ